MTRLSIDIGGTFTDIVLEANGRHATHKVLTTPARPEAGAMGGITELLARENVVLADVDSIIHGTTLATNALIERKGARVGFVTTAGFRDILEMRNEKRFDQYDLNIELPQPLVSREMRLTLDERILTNGDVLRGPALRQIDAIADDLIARNVEAVAIGFLHAYVNPAHEVLVAERLAQKLGDDVTICLSAQVSSEAREYDRFSTVCANAYVRPLMSRYLAGFSKALSDQGFSGSFLMMLSGGGLTTLDQAMKTPIRLVESGPAGGVALAAHVAREIGSAQTLALDIGGTTAKICFLENAIPQTTRKFEVARAWRDIKGSGLPVRVPTIELVEIGAGGGSIAKVDALSRLTVGPKSAGASPGPCAYQLGGTDATLTDAHIVLGNVSPEGFSGGSITLDPNLSVAAIEEQLAAPLGLKSAESAASGVVEMADEIMANAARVHGLELGKDISRFDLLVSGGGGALHAARIAEKLSIDRIIVPHNAGVGSAVGFLHAPVSFELARSVMQPVSKLDAQAVEAAVVKARDETRSVIAAIADPEAIEITAHAELRYAGQGQEVRLDFDADAPFAPQLANLEERFHAAYKSLYKFTMREIDVEFFSFSVTATAHLKSSALSIEQGDTADRSQAPDRQVYDLDGEAFIPFHTVSRDQWMPGETVPGPAIITESQTTTLIRKGWSCHKLASGHLILERVHPA